jgi:hypothetical protein
MQTEPQDCSREREALAVSTSTSGKGTYVCQMFLSRIFLFSPLWTNCGQECRGWKLGSLRLPRTMAHVLQADRSHAGRLACQARRSQLAGRSPRLPSAGAVQGGRHQARRRRENAQPSPRETPAKGFVWLPWRTRAPYFSARRSARRVGQLEDTRPPVHTQRHTHFEDVADTRFRTLPTPTRTRVHALPSCTHRHTWQEHVSLSYICIDIYMYIATWKDGSEAKRESRNTVRLATHPRSTNKREHAKTDPGRTRMRTQGHTTVRGVCIEKWTKKKWRESARQARGWRAAVARFPASPAAVW